MWLALLCSARFWKPNDASSIETYQQLADNPDSQRTIGMPPPEKTTRPASDLLSHNSGLVVDQMLDLREVLGGITTGDHPEGETNSFYSTELRDPTEA